MAHLRNAHIIRQAASIAHHPARDHHIRCDRHAQRQHHLYTAQEKSSQRKLAIQRIKEQRPDHQHRRHREIALVNPQRQDQRHSAQRQPHARHPRRCIGRKRRQKQSKEIRIRREHIAERRRHRRIRHQKRHRYQCAKTPLNAQQAYRKARRQRQAEHRKRADQPRHAVRAIPAQHDRQKPAPRLRAVFTLQQMIDIVMIEQVVRERVHVRDQPHDHRHHKRPANLSRHLLPKTIRRHIWRQRAIFVHQRSSFIRRPAPAAHERSYHAILYHISARWSLAK